MAIFQSNNNKSLEEKYHVTIYDSAGKKLCIREMRSEEFINFEQHNLSRGLDYDYKRLVTA